MDKLARLCAALPVALAVMVAGIAVNVNWALTATVLAVGGIGYPTVDQATMKAALGGLLDDGTNTFVNVPWGGQAAPFKGTMTLGQSVAIGVDNLYAAIMDTPGLKIAAGVSGGTLVINEVMRRLMNDSDAPRPEDLSFVVVGDAERGILPAVTPVFGPTVPILDYTAEPVPVTPYDVMVVKGEYDGIADWPDRPWNLLAVFNALAGSGIWPGFGSAHGQTIWEDPSTLPAENITSAVNVKGGVTTTYLVPVAELPMLQPLRDRGAPEVEIAQLNSVLKPLVDAGYSRNDPRPGRPVNTSGVRKAAAAVGRNSPASPAQTRRAISGTSANAC